MTNKRVRHPNWAVLPGETIRETLAERHWTQAECAARMGISQGYLSEIIHGKRAISGLVAVRLEHATGIAATLWANLQANYDVAVARREFESRATRSEP